MNSTENGKSTPLSRSSANSAAHAGHRERMRHRAEMDGAEALRPHELIELLLFYAIPRRDVNVLAHELVRRFGGVRGVLTADEAALSAVPGVGARAARLLARVGEVCAAYADLRAEDRPLLGNLRAFRTFACRYRPFVDGEQTWQFCLSYEGRLLLARPIAPGRAWAEGEYLRGALDDALSSHAYSALLAQFVDDPQPVPNEYDREHTPRYARTLFQVEVALLDHLLVGSEGVYSMREHRELCLLALEGERAPLAERYLGPPPTPASRLREEESAVDTVFDADEPQI